MLAVAFSHLGCHHGDVLPGLRHSDGTIGSRLPAHHRPLDLPRMIRAARRLIPPTCFAKQAIGNHYQPGLTPDPKRKA